MGKNGVNATTFGFPGFENIFLYKRRFNLRSGSCLYKMLLKVHIRLAVNYVFVQIYKEN